MSFIWFSFYKAEFLESHMRPGTHICMDSTEKSPLLDRWSVFLVQTDFLHLEQFLQALQPLLAQLLQLLQALQVLEALQVLGSLQVLAAEALQVGQVLEVAVVLFANGHDAAAPVIAITKKTNIKMLTALIIVFCIIFSSNFLVCVNSKTTLLLKGS